MEWLWVLILIAVILVVVAFSVSLGRLLMLAAVLGVLYVLFVVFVNPGWVSDAIRDDDGVSQVSSSNESAEDQKQAILNEVDGKILAAREEAKAELQEIREEIQDSDAEVVKAAVADLRKRVDEVMAKVETASSSGAAGTPSGVANPVATATGVNSAPSGKPGPVTVTNLLDGRSTEPRMVAGKIPGTDCPAYQDTGTLHGNVYKCSVPEGWTVFAFGVQFDDNLSSDIDRHWDNGGIMAYFGPIQMDVTIYDGAYTAVPTVDAYPKYCEVRQMHLANHWLFSNAGIPADWDESCGEGSN